MRKRRLKPILKKIIAIILLAFLIFSCIGAIITGFTSNSTHTNSVLQVSAPIVQENIIESTSQVEEINNSTITEETLILPKEEDLTYITMYTTTDVNIRIAPSTEAVIDTTVPINTEVIVTVYPDYFEDLTPDWKQVQCEKSNYGIGYIYAKYLSTEKTVLSITARNNDLTNARIKTSAAAAQESIYLGDYTLTYYCSCTKCCGSYANGITAWGTKAVAGRTIAAPSNFAFGTKLVINGHKYTVEDRGGAIKGKKIDIYVNSHSEALALGIKRGVPVYQIK